MFSLQFLHISLLEQKNTGMNSHSSDDMAGKWQIMPNDCKQKTGCILLGYHNMLVKFPVMFSEAVVLLGRKKICIAHTQLQRYSNVKTSMTPF